MKLDDFVAVSGMSGVFKLAANRNNGLIVEDLDNGKRKFASARKHQFTPLASIGIFTYEDSTELSVIFKIMQEQLEENPPLTGKASTADYHDYFRKILNDFDEDRVHTSDIKKVIKWFLFLNERNLLIFDEENEEESTEEENVESSEEGETVKEEKVATPEENE